MTDSALSHSLLIITQEDAAAPRDESNYSRSGSRLLLRLLILAERSIDGAGHQLPGTLRVIGQ